YPLLLHLEWVDGSRAFAAALRRGDSILGLINEIAFARANKLPPPLYILDSHSSSSKTTFEAKIKRELAQENKPFLLDPSKFTRIADASKDTPDSLFIPAYAPKHIPNPLLT